MWLRENDSYGGSWTMGVQLFNEYEIGVVLQIMAFQEHSSLDF